MPARRRHVISFAAAMVLGCITRAGPAQGPAREQTTAHRLEVVASKLPHTPDECIADADCGRTDCCGYGDGCAPPRHQADCSDAMCAKHMIAACRCQMGQCIGFFWAPAQEAALPKTYYLVE